MEAAAAVSHVIRSDKNDDYDDAANADGDDGQLDAINKGSNNNESSDEDVYEDANDDSADDDKNYTMLGSIVGGSVALTTAGASNAADDVLKAELGEFIYFYVHRFVSF